MRHLRFTLVAWVSIPWLAGADFQPDPAAVVHVPGVRHDQAYRYPQAGWTVVHIQGQPHERGVQHGRLLAAEIADYVRCFARMQSPKAPAEGWKQTRTLVNALFLRKFDPEYLEEMKGIADGAAAAGARFEGRAIDLLDIACINAWAEVETLDSALDASATGLERLRFPHPRSSTTPKPERCSAFAAVGPATADGKIVLGHITMYALPPARHFNIWLDIQPHRGHRVLMQTFPGGIYSGLDYYLNAAGLVLAETTIDQTPFNPDGLTVASRARKAMQYADTIDKAVDILKTANNGLYANEWLLGDIKTNEIAMFELGTRASKLWRSSKNEWFGGTPGFYWGCNNAKDLQVRLETVPDLAGRPANVVWCCTDRDQKWLELYAKHKGKIDADFAKLAFSTPPLDKHHSIDAKFTTTELAKQLKSWALFGPPSGRTWLPTDEEKEKYPDIRPLVANSWTLLHGQPPAVDPPRSIQVADLPRQVQEEKDDDEPEVVTVPAWRGTLLPKGDADVWLAAGFADYEKIVALEEAFRLASDGKLSRADRDRLAVELFAHRSRYLSAVRECGDTPLSKLRASTARDDWHRVAGGKGVLLLHQLRQLLGSKVFAEAMDSFGRAHAGQSVSTEQFRQHLEKSADPKLLQQFFATWLETVDENERGPAFSILSFYREPEQTLIVYGTADEAPANRETAERLRQAIIDRGCNFPVPLKADRDVPDDELKQHHVLLVGRPACNQIVQRFRERWPVAFGSQSFVVRDETYAHPGSAVIVAADNPLNPRFSAVLFAGLGAESTWHLPAAWLANAKEAEALVLPYRHKARPLVLQAKELVRDLK